MSNTTRNSFVGIALLLSGLSLILAVNLTASRTARANPGVLYAAPAAQGSGDCSSWANACTLQTALAQAQSGDEIWVRAGVHYPGTARTDTFTLKNGVALYGGFAGTETSRDARDWQANVTILSGDIDQNDINADGNYIAETWNDIVGNNAYHVVTGSETDESAVLDGFIITAGQANGGSPNNSGGGMTNSSGSPTLTNVTFSGNLASWVGGGMVNYFSNQTLTNVTFSGNWSYYGGGMYNYESNPTLSEVAFNGNSATYYGGGMYNTYSSSPTLTNVTFSGNWSSYGGGMANDSSSPTLTNVTFSGNWSYYGGGMHNYESNPTLSEVAFNGNSATYYGGGMSNWFSNPTLTDVTFSGNSASHGGGMFNYFSNPTLTNVTFSGNSSYYGGGMYNTSSSPTLTDVTFSGNSASHGGGMANESSGPTLTNVTFSGNSATNGGGGMANWQSNPTLTNVTFSSNTASEGGGMYNNGSSSTLTNVIFSGNSAGYGSGMFSDNSNPTLTNVTFSGNSATSNGGGMYNRFSSPTLNNVIIWANTASTGSGIYNYGGTPFIAYSDIQGCGRSGAGWNGACGTDGGGNIDDDPRFVDAANGNLRLQLTSPAIDAGNNAAVPAGIVTDLDGNPRFVDISTVPNTGNGIPPIVDMGAYEAQYVDVALGKAVLPPTVAPGQPITFALTLTNTGSIPATGVLVTDTLPTWLGGASFISTLVITDTGYTSPYVWQVQDLAPGQSGVITVSGVLTLPLAAGTYTNTALLSAAGDLLAANNTAVITFNVLNVAPVFTSAPVVTATQDAPYTYTATARDDNGDVLTITAPVLPAWLTLVDHGDGTATLSGTPSNADVGEHPVLLRVTDSGGLTDTQSFTITVSRSLLRPGAFSKVEPVNGATNQDTTLSLRWNSSTDAAEYQYCLDITNNSACDTSWVSAGANLSADLTGLAEGTTYYWQVRASNAVGVTDADNGAWWSFTTEGVRRIFLPLVLRN